MSLGLLVFIAMFLFKVNTSLLPIKLHYFFYFGATAPLYSFLPVIAQGLGFSNSTIGVIFAVVPLVAVLATPAMGAIADALNLHRVVFLVFLALDAALYFSFQFVPSLPSGGSSVDIFDGGSRIGNCSGVSSDLTEFLEGGNKVECLTVCEDRIEFIPSEVEFVWGSCYEFNATSYQFVTGNCSLLHCSSDLVIHFTAEPVATSMHDMIQFSSFWYFLLVVALNRFSSAVVNSMTDTICFKLLKNKRLGYGGQRLWGTVGYGITAPVSSYLVDVFAGTGTARKRNYKPAFYVSLLIFICDLVVASRIKVEVEEKSKGVMLQLRGLVSRIDTMVFLVATFAMGVYNGVLWVYLFIYVEAIAVEASSNNWITTLEGLMIAVQCSSEIPAFLISTWILRRIGHKMSYTLILAAWALRFSLYYIILNPWLVLPVELANALTFGLAYATMTNYADSVAPRGAEAAVQGVTSAVFEGAGVAAGGLLGGVFIDWLGPRCAFLCFGLSALGFCLVHLTFQGVSKN